MNGEQDLRSFELMFEEMKRDAARRREPAGFVAGRERAFARFLSIGFPAPRSEEWKYTDVRPVATGLFCLPPEHAAGQEVNLPRLEDEEEARIVFIDGVYSARQSTASGIEGVEVLPLREALANGGAARLQEVLGRDRPGDGDTFPTLNAAFMTDGVMLSVARGAAVSRRLHILLLSTGAFPGLMVSPRIHIRAERGSSARVVQSHIGGSGVPSLTNAVTDIEVGENADLFYCKVQSEGAEALHVGHVRAVQERSSRLALFDFSRGARWARNEVYARLDGEGAELDLKGMYAVRGRQHLDHHTVVDHRIGRCTSRQTYKGILGDSARGVFNGRIVVRPGAALTDAFQLNKNLLLSRRASVDTKPQLEIENDNVRCTHGATVGQLNDDQIFYLQSRGIDKKDAKAILARGFVEDILFEIEDRGFQASLRSLLAGFFESPEVS